MINRIEGTGALSNIESQALWATAMSPENPRPRNEVILQGYKNGLEIMKEHQAFMNYFIDKTGGNPDLAQTMWNLYKKENPIVVKDKTGSFVINKSRNPWQKFDFGTAYKNFISGEAGAPQTEAPPDERPVVEGQGGRKFYVDHATKTLIPVGS
jgi:NADH:ubiquinone oxidoreductase subunit